jgi:hypothetical protein
MKVYQLPKEAVRIVSTLSTAASIAADHGKAAIAQAVCDYYSIPSAPLKDPKGWYMFNRSEDINHLLGELNELFAIDISTIADYAYMFFSFRYNVTYPQKRMAISSEQYAALDALGYTRSFSASLSPEVFSKDIIAYSTIYNGVSDLLVHVNDVWVKRVEGS